MHGLEVCKTCPGLKRRNREPAFLDSKRNTMLESALGGVITKSRVNILDGEQKEIGHLTVPNWVLDEGILKQSLNDCTGPTGGMLKKCGVYAVLEAYVDAAEAALQSGEDVSTPPSTISENQTE